MPRAASQRLISAFAESSIIHVIATTRMRDWPATRAYVARRTAEARPQKSDAA